MTAWLKKVFNKDGETMETDGSEMSEYEQEGAEDDEEDGQLAVDMFQDKDNLVIKSTIAGVKPEDLDISLSEDTVVIRGQRKHQQTVKNDEYYYQECYWGSFSRALKLPVEVDADRCEADLRDGILTLTLPVASKAKTKKIRIKSDV